MENETKDDLAGIILKVKAGLMLQYLDQNVDPGANINTSIMSSSSTKREKLIDSVLFFPLAH